MNHQQQRYKNNNQNWLFFHPIVGDNWTHLVEQECFRDSDNYCVINADLENKQNKTKKKSNFS